MTDGDLNEFIFEHRLDQAQEIEAAERDALRAYTAAPPTWKEKAKAEVERWAEGGGPFTSEDLKLLCDDPPEPRSWGHIIRRAHREGLIEPTGAYLNKGSHGRPIREWKGKDKG